ncbi:hypothetical protein FACS1894184_17510 [Clostridia bacterium]|nr:hypothetical protein FACS1894184_17510 [Clostridia bacterium]
MASGEATMRLNIGGMTCPQCQNRITRALCAAKGVSRATVSYSAGTADITYDKSIIDTAGIVDIIEKLDYKVLTDSKSSGTARAAGMLIIIAALYMLLQHFGILNRLVPSQLAEGGMGYSMLFVVGLLTSVHCIAMCGGINLSQSIRQNSAAAKPFDAFLPTVLYNVGRVISYTAVGFILGLVGMLFGGGGGAGLPVAAQGILKLIAGVFMIIMGVNMLGLFPALRKFQPRLPAVFTRKANAGKAGKGPLIVGLLNGLMPCGPLQSMQILALASGNPIAGGMSMLMFSLGTVPLMLGLGTIVSALGKRFTHKVMTAGAVLVVVLGLAMLSQGGGLLNLNIQLPGSAVRNNNNGVTQGINKGGAAAENIVTIVEGTQVLNSVLRPGAYPNITVKAGMPVKWTINAPDGSINGCNNRLNIYEYGIMNYGFQYGDNVIEFTPDKAGRFQYTCWMGMIRGTITVE